MRQSSPSSRRKRRLSAGELSPPASPTENVPTDVSGVGAALNSKLERCEGLEERRKLLEEALEAVSKSGSLKDQANIQFMLGHELVRQGEFTDTTLAVLRDAVRSYERLGLPLQAAEAQYVLGGAAWAASDADPKLLYEVISANRAAVQGLGPAQDEIRFLCRRVLGLALIELGDEASILEASAVLSEAAETAPAGYGEDVRDLEGRLIGACLTAGNEQLAVEHLYKVGAWLTPDQSRRWLNGYLANPRLDERPAFRAAVLGLLAVDLLTIQVGHRAQNVSRAIGILESVLAVAGDNEQVPLVVVQCAHYGLCYAYRVRIVGDLDENHRRAREHGAEAVGLARELGITGLQAQAHSELGLAWRETRTGDVIANLNHAVEHLEYADALLEGSDDLRFQHDVEFQHEMRNDLATTLLMRGAEGDLSEAITVLEDLVRELSPDEEFGPWAGARQNLAVALMSRGQPTDADEAIHFLTESVNAYEARGFHEDLDEETRDLRHARLQRDWATAQSNLALAWHDKTTGETPTNLHNASQAYEMALSVLTPERYPSACRWVCWNYSGLLIQLDDWPAVRDHLAVAIQALEREFEVGVTPATIQSLQKETAKLYERLVRACLSHTPPLAIEALRWVEEGRSRLLRTQLATLELPVPPHDEQDLRLALEGFLLWRLRNLSAVDSTELSGGDARAHFDALQKTRNDLSAVWAELEGDPNPSFGEYVALRRGETFDYEQLRLWLAHHSREAALVEYFVTQEGVWAFIVGANRSEPQVIQIATDVATINECVKLCRREVYRYDPDWPLEESWQELARPLVAPVLECLKDVELIYLVPHAGLHSLPLHAVVCSGSNSSLLDMATVMLVPSALVAIRISSTRGLIDPTSATALVVGNATEDLSFADEEARRVSDFYAVEPLMRASATIDKVVEGLRGVDVAHFACHAHFDAVDPFNSGVELADGALTARELAAMSLDLRLAVLSACETGAVHVGSADELFGLSRAFMYAGVPQLMATMWPIDDPTTLEIMVDVYSRLKSSQALPALPRFQDALREAVIAARNRGEPSHMWAPFVMIGTEARR
jgi:CHAT domain-containing protein/tetratricopeptide (TPR) repeat protein